MENRIKYWAEKNKIEISNLYCKEDIYYFSIENKEVHMRQLLDLADRCGTNDIVINVISNNKNTSSICINVNTKNYI